MIMSAQKNCQQACFWGLKNKHFWLRGCGPSLCVCMLVVVVAVLSAYDDDCARIPWASRRFGGEAGLADRESLQLRPCWPNIEPRWPNIEPQMIGQKEKKSWAAAPFRRPISGPQNQPSIRKETNCRSGNWPRFWGQIWCWKGVFSVCMCSLKWSRGVCICPASWPGVKNTIADLCVQVSQTIIALCLLWWFRPPILQHVFSSALIYIYIYTPYFQNWHFEPSFLDSPEILGTVHPGLAMARRNDAFLWGEGKGSQKGAARERVG